MPAPPLYWGWGGVGWGRVRCGCARGQRGVGVPVDGEARGCSRPGRCSRGSNCDCTEYHHNSQLGAHSGHSSASDAPWHAFPSPAIPPLAHGSCPALKPPGATANLPPASPAARPPAAPWPALLSPAATHCEQNTWLHRETTGSSGTSPHATQMVRRSGESASARRARTSRGSRLAAASCVGDNWGWGEGRGRLGGLAGKQAGALPPQASQTLQAVGRKPPAWHHPQPY